VAAALLVAFAFTLPGAAAAEPLDTFEAEARHVLEDSSLQSSPPQSAKPKRPAHEPETDAGPPRRAGDRGDATLVPNAAVSLAGLVFWVLIALVAAALLAVIWRGVSERWALRAGTSSRRDDDEARPSRAGGKPSARSWQELASQARYSDAVHCLLLEALQRLDVAARQGRALTSREVLQRARLNPERRAALEELILTVERSLFGGAALQAGDYERCLSALQRFGYG
jgi:hypothetical protein